MFEEAQYGAPKPGSPRERAQQRQCWLLRGVRAGCPCPSQVLCIVPPYWSAAMMTGGAIDTRESPGL